MNFPQDWESSDDGEREDEKDENKEEKKVTANEDLKRGEGDIKASLLAESEKVLDAETLKQSWKLASRRAMIFLQENVRQVQLVPLVSQPVISSVLDLHLLFGQYW